MSFDREAIEAEIEAQIASDGDVFDFGFSFADTDEVYNQIVTQCLPLRRSFFLF